MMAEYAFTTVRCVRARRRTEEQRLRDATRRLSAVGLLLLTFGCAADQPDPRADPALMIGAGSSEADLRQLLVHKQRALLGHIYDRELAELTDLLDPRFTWTLRTPEVGLGGESQPQRLSYLEVVAGSYPAELGIEATNFEVLELDSAAAVVRAGLIHVPNGATTAWRLVGGEWKAVWMVGLPIDG